MMPTLGICSLLLFLSTAVLFCLVLFCFVFVFANATALGNGRVAGPLVTFAHPDCGVEVIATPWMLASGSLLALLRFGPRNLQLHFAGRGLESQLRP